ncbi:HD domain-containing protein [bacterium]|nr:HD domain-containing protein [bacterium]
MAFKALPRAARLYVLFMIAAALAVIVGVSTVSLERAPDFSFAVYVALSLAASPFVVKIPYSKVHFSVDTAFVFTILILYGPLPAAIVDAVGKAIMTLNGFRTRKLRTRDHLFKLPFNMASGVLSVFGAYILFQALTPHGIQSSADFVLPIIGVTLAYYVLNTGTVAIAICITEPQNVFTFWARNFLQTGIGYMTSGSIATLLLIMDSIESELGFLVTIPIGILVIFSQRIYLQKEEDAIKHIDELEKLHLSTFESLALAIDAKDPHTHGHVHRVRHLAVGLARKLGIVDEEHLTGLSFAALVHDIGKIAIPDAILKKPGKYSDREFLVMQSHSIIGAEMLRNLPIPFPVAKIVRHHHEKWNGGGYPDGLAGEEIPLDSRIITVADIYDAIRSSRPYRARMERERALQIMASELGQSIDPHIGAVFLRHIDELDHEVEMVDSRIIDIVRATKLDLDFFAEPDKPAPTSERELALFNGLTRIFSADADLEATLHELAAVVATVVAYSALVVYLPDERRENLEPRFVHGLDVGPLRSNSVPAGAGVTGWVYNARTPTVTRPDAAEFRGSNGLAEQYRLALSVPVVATGDPVAVLTMYSEFGNAFGGEEQDLLYGVSAVMAALIEARLRRVRSARPALRSVAGV